MTGNVHVIQNELHTGQEGRCENCEEINPHVRPVEEFSAISRVSRGYRKICFDCFGPRVWWRKKNLKEGKTYESPITNWRDKLSEDKAK